MLDELEILYKQYESSLAGRDTQVRCFGHILNLVYHVSVLFASEGLPTKNFGINPASGPRKKVSESSFLKKLFQVRTENSWNIYIFKKIDPSTW